MTWTTVDPHNPAAMHLVALYSDGSGAQVLSKFDNNPNFHMADDGWELCSNEVEDMFSWWAPAPEGFVPHFMEVTTDG